jgi:hypothetical protein
VPRVADIAKCGHGGLAPVGESGSKGEVPMRCGAWRMPTTNARRAARRPAGGTGAVMQRASASCTVAVRAASVRAGRSPRHRFDCVQNSESAQAIQGTVPHRPGPELHPRMRARTGGKEYRRVRARRHGRARRTQRVMAGSGSGWNANGSRCDIGAQVARCREVTGTAGGEARRQRRRARAPRAARVDHARTADDACGVAEGEGGLHGPGRTRRNRGVPRSVRERHRKPLPGDPLHVR